MSSANDQDDPDADDDDDDFDEEVDAEEPCEQAWQDVGKRLGLKSDDLDKLREAVSADIAAKADTVAQFRAQTIMAVTEQATADVRQRLASDVTSQVAAAMRQQRERNRDKWPAFAMIPAAVVLFALLIYPGNCLRSRVGSLPAKKDPEPTPVSRLDKALETGWLLEGTITGSSSADGDYLVTGNGVWLVRGSEAVRVTEVKQFSTPTTRPHFAPIRPSRLHKPEPESADSGSE